MPSIRLTCNDLTGRGVVLNKKGDKVTLAEYNLGSASPCEKPEEGMHMSSWFKRTALVQRAIALMGAAPRKSSTTAPIPASRRPSTPTRRRRSRNPTSFATCSKASSPTTPRARSFPGQATKWEISDDGKTYRFTLARRDQVVERRSGQGVGFRLFLSAHHEPADGAKYANILYPILNAEKANKGPGKVEDIGVKASTTRRSRSSSSSRPPISSNF